ncbi:MAG: septum formation protein Maf [Ruminococcaceae bacterium]|nr:septum formation protein Maf [Oscillospiraceae bacterium]
MSDIQLILASASPRRREILSSLGLSFEIVIAETDETCDLSDPGQRVEHISGKKCLAVMELMAAEGRLTEQTLILASDTLVTLDGIFLGKPRDHEDACRMIRMLSGRGHTVASGIALWYRGALVTAHELTTVHFAAMSDEDIQRYVATDEPMGKAGAYAIQGQAARYVTGIEGDYFNVVGLPVHRLYTTVKEAFDITL